MTLNELVAFNVRYVAKRKGLKIGEIEKEVGVRIGYFSRKSQTDTSTSLEVIYKTAKILDVSIDELCTDLRLKELNEVANECGYKLVPIEKGAEE